jgi:hypothetical protein
LARFQIWDAAESSCWGVIKASNVGDAQIGLSTNWVASGSSDGKCTTDVGAMAVICRGFKGAGSQKLTPYHTVHRCMGCILSQLSLHESKPKHLGEISRVGSVHSSLSKGTPLAACAVLLRWSCGELLQFLAHCSTEVQAAADR